MAPMTATGTENLDSYGDFQSMGAPSLPSTANVNGVRNAGTPFALLDWYQGDGPWDPLVGKNTPPSRQDDPRGRGHMSAPLKNNGPAFQGYRVANTVPSECDTLHTGVLPSDSGYGSGPRPSIGNPSVYDELDHNTETQSLIEPLMDFNLANHPYIQPTNSQNGTSSMDQDNNNLICAYCDQRVKTKSELNKHRQRHTKPFHCSFPGCNRTGGFSTKNDLDRHTRSRHPRETAIGNRYICRNGPCKNKEKIWPRADNFRQHLKRVHKQEVSADDDLDTYLYRDQSSICATDLVGMGSSVANFTLGPTSEPHTISTPGYLLERPGLSPHLRGYDGSYGNEFVENSLDYQPASGLGNGSQYSMLTSSTTDDMHHQSIGAMSHLDFGLDDSDDQADSPQEHCIDGPGPRDTRYIQPDILKQDSASTEKQPQEHIQFKNRDSRALSKADSKAIFDATGGASEPEARSEQIIVGGASCDDAIAVDDEDAPADELSPRSTPSGSAFKDESSDQKDEASSQVKSASMGPSESMDLDDEDKAAALLKDLQKKGVLAKLMEELGYQRATKTTATKPKRAASSSHTTQETSSVTCDSPGCNKSFVRRCELKKHMKRHEKPYGCTYFNCTKKFGSKNDWKRHENSQHFQLEVWKCNEKLKDSPDSICGKACHRRETFKYHLQKDHEIQDPKAIEQKWEDCRVGRNCETRFWCGFCKKIVEIKEKGLEAWTERFNHIDDHFSGRVGEKMMIDQWKSVDPDLPEMVFSPRSDDGSEESSPKPATPPTAHPPPADANEKLRTSKKRKAAAEDIGPSKRPAHDTFVWFCCKCRNQVGYLALAAACMEPDCNGHQRCNDCALERTI